MPTYQVKQMVDGSPTFEKPLTEIVKDCKLGGAIKILSPAEYISVQMRKWYRGPCLHGLSAWNGDTIDEWDMRLKDKCNGVEYLNKESIYLGPGSSCTRLTIKDVPSSRMRRYIDNILSAAIENDWPVTPPDKELRR